jgi:arginase
MRRIAILDAPSNLGLRPPTETSVPGCAKAPGALRDHGLLTRLGARDAGCLTPPRYDPGDWRPGDGVCHASEIAAYSRKLADRIGAIIDTGEFPVILGGDCSIVLGSGLAMHRLGDAVGGRIGLVFVDGHSDFRHPGNASYVGAAAGEDLALVTGRGQADLAAIEGRRPYFRDIDVVVLGIRAQDEYRLDLQAAGIVTRPVPTLRVEGAARTAQWARDQLVDCAGFWVHVDMDVLDPAVMPAVDAPEPGGIAFPELELLLAGLVDTPHCLGVEITVFDPDYDPDGAFAEEITSALVAGLTPVRHVDRRPDLVAAREDLASSRPPGHRPAQAASAAFSSSRVHGLAPAASESASSSSRVHGLAPKAPESASSGVHGLAPPASASSEHRADPGVSGSPDSDDEPVVHRLDEPWPAEEPDPVAARRAAAADDGVALAAAGMSAGVSTADGVTEDSAVPATTLLGVEEADAVESFPPDESEISEEDAAGRGEPDAAAQDEADPDSAGSADAQPDSPAGSPDDDSHEPADHWSDAHADVDHPSEDDLRPGTRPLGSAPLLDSEPLPATMPGMLRPRPAEGFSLPAQRPAFDIGPEEPADIS